MSQHRYVLADAPDASERARLDVLEAVNDPSTRRRLSALGLSPGWRCLDVAAGGGSVARWLAGEVGPTGSVVATDMNPRFLVDLPANVEVRRHDILVDDLETDAFDLVHCRSVLMHLPDPKAALARMAAAVRPGGWLCAEEGDWGLLTLAGHPDAAEATVVLHRIVAAYREAGITNVYFGRELPGLVAGLGFAEVGGDGWAAVAADGHLAIALHQRNAEYMRRGVVELGLASEEDFDRFQAILGDQRLVLLGATTVGVWARKPGDPGLLPRFSGTGVA